MSDPAAGEELLPGELRRSSSAIRLQAQALEFVPRLPAPVRHPAAIHVLACAPPPPPASIFVEGSPPPPPPPPPHYTAVVVGGGGGAGFDVVPEHAAGLQQGIGGGVNPAPHQSAAIGGARCYVVLYRNVNIAPLPLNQGQYATCNFCAVARGAQMQVHKHHVDDNQPCDIIMYPNANVNEYCQMRKIRKMDINNPCKDWPKEVRFNIIQWLGKHCGIEAVSGNWPNPKRIQLQDLVFLGKHISHTKLADFLDQGNPLLCQIIVDPGFDTLGPNQVWSCEPRFDGNGLVGPYYYHMIVLVKCGKENEPVTFLNSGGEGFGDQGYGLIMLKDVKWFHSFNIRYPLKFVLPGTSLSKLNDNQPNINAPTCRVDHTFASGSSRLSPRSRLVMQEAQETKGSGTLPWRSNLVFQNPSTINAARWGKVAIQQETEGRYQSKSVHVPGASSNQMENNHIDARRWCKMANKEEIKGSCTSSLRPTVASFGDLDQKKSCTNGNTREGTRFPSLPTLRPDPSWSRTIHHGGQMSSSSGTVATLEIPMCQSLLKAVTESSSSKMLSDGPVTNNTVSLISASSLLSSSVAKPCPAVDANRMVCLTENVPSAVVPNPQDSVSSSSDETW